MCSDDERIRPIGSDTAADVRTDKDFESAGASDGRY